MQLQQHAHAIPITTPASVDRSTPTQPLPLHANPFNPLFLSLCIASSPSHRRRGQSVAATALAFCSSTAGTWVKPWARWWSAGPDPPTPASTDAARPTRSPPPSTCTSSTVSVARYVDSIAMRHVQTAHLVTTPRVHVKLMKNRGLPANDCALADCRTHSTNDRGVCGHKTRLCR